MIISIMSLVTEKFPRSPSVSAKAAGTAAGTNQRNAPSAGQNCFFPYKVGKTIINRWESFIPIKIGNLGVAYCYFSHIQIIEEIVDCSMWSHALKLLCKESRQ